MAKDESAPIEIFRAGTHRAAGGETLTFGEDDLADCAGAYDKAKHEAPLVVGHPAADKPAYGWVAGLTAKDGALFAEPAQVDESFAEMVRAGRFKKISASFYKPDAEANPVPGTWYLRHVGFLGAQAPSVKGLRAVHFQDGEDGQIETVEFAGAVGWVIPRILRRLRDWMIDSEGQEKADAILPQHDIDFLQEQAAMEDLRQPAPEWAEGMVDGEILFFDRFGNGITNISQSDLSAAVPEAVTLGNGEEAFFRGHYAEMAASPERIAAIWNSDGRLELALYGQSLRQSRGFETGERVRVKLGTPRG